MESEFEITPDLQAAINLVSAVGKNLPYETRQNLVKSFTGRKQALVALRSLFAANGVDESEIEEFIFDAGNWCDNLDDAAFSLTVQPGKNILPLVELGKRLTRFAELEQVRQRQSKGLRHIRQGKMMRKLRSFTCPDADIYAAGLRNTGLASFKYSGISSTEQAAFLLADGKI